MELESLRQAWREDDRRLEASLVERFEARLASQRLVRRLQHELLGAIAPALWLGTFLADHSSVVRFALPALVLQLALLSGMASNVWQLALLGRIDARATSGDLRSVTERVAALRARNARWILRLSPLLWTPLAIVGAERLFGFDVTAAFGYRWVAANVAVTLGVSGLWVFASARGTLRSGSEGALRR